MLFEFFETRISLSFVFNDDLSLLVIHLEDQVSVSSLHSQSVELLNAFISSYNTGLHLCSIES